MKHFMGHYIMLRPWIFPQAWLVNKIRLTGLDLVTWGCPINFSIFVFFFSFFRSRGRIIMIKSRFFSHFAMSNSHFWEKNCIFFLSLPIITQANLGCSVYYKPSFLTSVKINMMHFNLKSYPYRYSSPIKWMWEKINNLIDQFW